MLGNKFQLNDGKIELFWLTIHFGFDWQNLVNSWSEQNLVQRYCQISWCTSWPHSVHGSTHHLCLYNCHLWSKTHKRLNRMLFNCELRKIASVRSLLAQGVTVQLVSSLIKTHLDYCLTVRRSKIMLQGMFSRNRKKISSPLSCLNLTGYLSKLE